MPRANVRYRHAIGALALLCVLSSLSVASPAPQGQTPSAVTTNPYLQLGAEAIASGLRTVTVSIEIGTEATLAQRINRVHFGMSLSGWSFVGQEALVRDGSSTALLLTYERRAPQGKS